MASKILIDTDLELPATGTKMHPIIVALKFGNALAGAVVKVIVKSLNASWHEVVNSNLGMLYIS